MSESNTNNRAGWRGLARMLDALAIGADARSKGLPKQANPFPIGSDEWTDWTMGWEWIDCPKDNVEWKGVQHAG